MKIAKTYALYSTIILSCTLILMTSVWFSQKTQEQRQIVHEQRSVFERYKAVLNLEKTSMMHMSLNYSRWDEMAAFVNTQDLSWSQAHLEPLLPTFGLDYIFIFDASKKQVYRHKSNAVQTINVDLSSLDASTLSFKEFFHYEDGVFIQFFLAPIHSSADVKQSGDAKGFLLLGRLFDDAFLKSMEEATLGKASLLSASDHPTLHEDFGLPLRSLHDDVIGYLHFSYISSTLLFMAEIQNFLILAGLIIVLGGIVLFHVLTYKIIFTPIRYISMALKSHNLNYIAALSRQEHELGEIAHLICEHEKQSHLLEHYKEAIDENTIVSKTNAKRHHHLCQ